jgi:hypothetical protein
LGVRSVRFYDLLAVHRVEANRSSHVLWPSPWEAQHSATYLSLASAWQDVNQTLFTFVLREKGEILGLAQGAARPGHDGWDLLRLALVPDDPEDRERAAAALIEQWLAAAAGRGALRAFVRAPVDGEGGVLLARQEFRRYTREYTLVAERLDLWPAPLPEHLEFRARRPADAWGIFQLYCSVAPPQVRHAEGLSSKRWMRGSKLAHALVGHWLPIREVVLTDEGLIVGWVRLSSIKGHAAQRLEVMLHARAHDALAALLAHAAVALQARLDCHTICHVREYEGAVLSGLQDAGFAVMDEHALLVKHTATRVTERQLLIAALRAQSLGIDISPAHHTPETGAPGLINLSTVESPLYDRTRAN